MTGALSAHASLNSMELSTSPFTLTLFRCLKPNRSKKAGAVSVMRNSSWMPFFRASAIVCSTRALPTPTRWDLVRTATDLRRPCRPQISNPEIPTISCVSSRTLQISVSFNPCVGSPDSTRRRFVAVKSIGSALSTSHLCRPLT